MSFYNENDITNTVKIACWHFITPFNIYSFFKHAVANPVKMADSVSTHKLGTRVFVHLHTSEETVNQVC